MSSRVLVRSGLLLAALSTLGAAPAEPTSAAEQPPREIGLVERSSRRLTQIDITAEGPAEALASLTAADFRIRVHLPTLARPVQISDFTLDRLCSGAGVSGTAGSTAADDGVPTPPAAGGAYMLYFDQGHLTMEGRVRALQLSREMVPRLVERGARVMIVSNAAALEVIEPLADSAAPVLDALDRLENDRSQWDLFAEREEQRVGEVVRALDDLEDVSAAVAIARRNQREESVRTARDLRRLQAALTQLVDLDAPRAVIYFADTMRSNAGEHYLTFFGRALLDREPRLTAMALDSFAQAGAFDNLVNAAAALGVRFYTVQARGLVSYFEHRAPSTPAMARTGAVPRSPRTRVADAQKTLQDLSAETGGAAFLHGAPAASIAGRILSDASCLFVASFDPVGLPEDLALPVSVTVARKGVKLHVRGRLVVQSAADRLRARLTGAFAAPGRIEDDLAARTEIVPTGFDDGRFSALVQLAVPGAPIQAATWDLGTSAVYDNRVHSESSGRLEVSAPGVAVVFESEMRFRPGRHEIVGVAHEGRTDLISSGRLRVEWPDPNAAAVTLAPIALLQPAAALFLRDGATREHGSLARRPLDPVLGDRPAALVGLVCRGRRFEEPLRVLRAVVGRERLELPELTIEAGTERCAQVRDLVPAGALGPGPYRYVIRVFADGRLLGEGERDFVVVADGEPAAPN